MLCNEDINWLAQSLGIYCLLNLHENEYEIVLKHLDDELMFGKDPVLASFGATLRFIVEPKLDAHSLHYVKGWELMNIVAPDNDG